MERPVGAESTVTEVPLEAVPALLAERFGIPDVALGDDGRLAARRPRAADRTAGRFSPHVARAASAGRAMM